MRYVLDCSVAPKWFLPEPRRAQARAALAEARAGRVGFLAPDILHPEFAHVLRKRVVGGEVERDEAFLI